MDDIRTFYNISEKHWVELTSSDPPKVINFYKFDISQLEHYDNKTVEGIALNSIINFNCFEKSEYHVLLLLNKKAFCFKEISRADNFKIFFSSPKNKETILLAENICFRFRLYYKDELLKKVFIDECGIEQTLREIKEYIFCDHYSLWLYNDITDRFTHLFSSYEIDSTFSKPNAEYNFPEGTKHKCEKFDASRNTNASLKDMKSLTRIKIELTSPDINNKKYLGYLTASFFSRHDDFFTRDETTSLIMEILNLKYSKVHFSKIITSNKVLADLSERRTENFDDYLNSCVHKITEDLDWEAASIFIKDSNDDLKLEAVCQSEKCDFINSVIYTKGDGSITYGIFEKGEDSYIYDINNDPNNSHKFDEKTQNDPKNWMGISLAAPKVSPVGVLRVLNKLDEHKRLVDFDSLDINILKKLAENIAYQYAIEQRFIKEEDFHRTSNHEIKTPLTLITTASSVLRTMICKEFDIKEDNLPKMIKNKLDDLEASTSRLQFVVKTKSFEASKLVEKREEIFIYGDIVAPVISFSVVYAEKKRKNLSYNKDKFIALPPVICDIHSSQMALHTVIDNAIKYSKENTEIIVRGIEENGFCKIIVESESSVRIEDEDKEHIFEKYYRTKEVEEKQIEGSGIGLHLAQEILRINNGKIRLTSLNNPTTFELFFPIY